MKKFVIAAALTIVSGLAMAGMWNNSFPIVGSGSYCGSTVNGSCVSTIAAGPSIVTGNETVPADTNLSGGRNPQTVLLSMKTLNALPINVQNNAAATTNISATNISGGVLILSNTTLTAANITLPPAPIDQQRYSVSSNATISTLTVAAGGTASMGTNANPGVLAVPLASSSQGYTFMYNAGDTKWYRLR